MSAIVAALLLLLLIASLASSSDEWHISASPAPELDALFQRTEGWIGADGDYSIRLDHNRVLWLFSDTFVGSVVGGRRVDTTMINNSAAIQRQGANDFVEFFYKADPSSVPQSFVTPDEAEGYYWLFSSTLTSEGLYLFLLRVVPDDRNPAFPFRLTGMSLGQVTDPSASPDRWHISQRRVPFTRFGPDESVFFGSATLNVGGYVYVYGLKSARKDGGKTSAMSVARVQEDSFGDFTAWRFLANGKWGCDFEQCDALISPMPTEFSVSYLPGVERYVTVYTEGGIFGIIAVRLAPKPEGPWSDPIRVYDCPDKNWHEKAYCYAAKAHPELATAPDELVVTYACNSTNFPDLFSDARLYWPRFVRVKISRKD